MADDGRTYIRLHDGMPDHPKVDPLSDKAFRLLVETWCWSSRHLTDGRVPAAMWARRGTPAARRELVESGLIDVTGDGSVIAHDYLEHQRSRAEVEEISAHRRASKQAASKLGNHRRWHVGPGGKPSADCEHCQRPSQKGSQEDPTWDPTRDRRGTPQGSITDIDTDRDTVLLGAGIGGDRPEVDARAPRNEPPAPNLDPRNPRCPRHRDVPADDPGPPCRACRDIRLELERTTSAPLRRDLEGRGCSWCDADGWRIDPANRHRGPLIPGVRCDHTPMAAQVAS